MILAIALPIRLLWWPFTQIEGKFDFFPFEDHAQSLKWYAHYTAYYLGEIAKSFAFFVVARAYLSNKFALVVTVFLFYDNFRLMSYWLFRWQFPMWILTVALIGFILTVYHYGKNSFNKVLTVFTVYSFRRDTKNSKTDSGK